MTQYGTLSSPNPRAGHFPSFCAVVTVVAIVVVVFVGRDPDRSLDHLPAQQHLLLAAVQLVCVLVEQTVDVSAATAATAAAEAAVAAACAAAVFAVVVAAVDVLILLLVPDAGIGAEDAYWLRRMLGILGWLILTTTIMNMHIRYVQKQPCLYMCCVHIGCQHSMVFVN